MEDILDILSRVNPQALQQVAPPAKPDMGPLGNAIGNINPRTIGTGFAGQILGALGSPEPLQNIGNAMGQQSSELMNRGVGLQQALAMQNLKGQYGLANTGVKAQSGQDIAGLKARTAIEQQQMKNVTAESIADKRIRAMMLALQAHGNQFYIDPQGQHWLQNKITGEVRPVPAPGEWMQYELGGGQQPQGAGSPNINVSVNAGGQPQGGPAQFTTPKNLTPAQQKDITGFDSALNRVNMLEEFIKQNPDVRTYPGAAVLHKVGQATGQYDPRFGQLETLSGEHLLKGIKADVGGRISNFEIKYGEGLFPNVSLRPQENLARIQTIRSLLMADRDNYLKTAALSGQRTGQFKQGGQQQVPQGNAAPQDPLGIR